MAGITINLPTVDAEQSIEIEVTINGTKQKYHYRIEVFPWEECQEKRTRADCLKDMISDYDQNWELVTIGGATDNYIPLTFRETN